MIKKRWTREEEEFLRNNCIFMTQEQMAIKLNRTFSSVKKKYSKLKLSSGKIIPVQMGEIFGRLTVIEKTDKRTKNGSIYFKCICVCGKITSISGNSLRRELTSSCGCYNTDRVKESHRLMPKEASYNNLESTIKNGAKSRKIKYDLTKEYFLDLISKDCYYCSSKPKPWNTYYNRKKRKIITKGVTDEWAEQQWVYINGIDRINNEKGYEIGNCVACCHICNIMKQTLTEKEFLDHIERIYNHQRSNYGKTA